MLPPTTPVPALMFMLPPSPPVFAGITELYWLTAAPYPDVSIVLNETDPPASSCRLEMAKLLVLLVILPTMMLPGCIDRGELVLKDPEFTVPAEVPLPP